jgi:hypothetical protein
MSIIRNIQNNIVVIYEIKSFYVTLAAMIFFANNIHPANYHFTNSKKTEKTFNTTVRWVVLCTVKNPLICASLSPAQLFVGAQVFMANSQNNYFLKLKFRNSFP